MSRPAVLVVEPDAPRRKLLSHGLSELGYEVVPAIDPAEGRKFAAGLGPSVVVAPIAAPGFGDGAVLEHLPATGQRTLLLLGEREDQGLELPEEVRFLAQHQGMSEGELVRRVQLVLLGREVGVEPDAALESLVGDLALVPFLELLRALHRAQATARLVLEGGELALEHGEVVAAAAGPVRGKKAFFRLAQADQGPFRVLFEPFAGTRDVVGSFEALAIGAIEDRVHGTPDRRARVRLQLGPAFFHTRFGPGQQALLGSLKGSPAVGRLLDTLPATDGELVRDLLQLADLGVVAFEEPWTRVRVVTDSTCDLPQEVARAHGIHVVPLMVLFGDRVYHDGVDLKAREFYELLERGKVHPRTNPPTRADFHDAYHSLIGRRDLVSLHLSEKLSQTVVHARAAAAEGLVQLQEQRGEDEPIEVHVLDSQSVSLGLGLLALFAARMARRGLEPAAIAERLAAMRRRLHLLFVVDTLEYLARGGRIGRARALVGGLLGIKPILGVSDGEVGPVDRVRGGRAAHPRLIELFAERVDPGEPVVVAVGHARAPVWGDRLRALIERRFRVAELMVAEIGPVVGTHAGPGAVGACFFQPTAEELPLIAPLPEAP
jgi:DegV family protein with EDD domain